MLRTIVLDDWENAAFSLTDWSSIQKLGELKIMSQYIGDDEDLLRKSLEGFHVIVLMREQTKFSPSLIAHLATNGTLKLIVTTGRRNLSLDIDACRQYNITVCGTFGGTSPVVEHTWALVLSTFRRIPEPNTSMHNGLWRPLIGSGLSGKKLGLLGLGRYGSKMVPIAKAFGMQVLAWSPNLTKERVEEVGRDVRLAEDKLSLFREADVVSIHMVLSESTQGMVGREELLALRADSWLVNTSRGPLVEENVLIEACREGWIKGAVLDVYDQEPLPSDHPLRSTPLLTLPPHVGYVTEDNFSIWFQEVVENIVAFQAGKPIRLIA